MGSNWREIGGPEVYLGSARSGVARMAPSIPFPLSLRSICPVASSHGQKERGKPTASPVGAGGDVLLLPFTTTPCPRYKEGVGFRPGEWQRVDVLCMSCVSM